MKVLLAVVLVFLLAVGVASAVEAVKFIDFDARDNLVKASQKFLGKAKGTPDTMPAGNETTDKG